MEANGEVERAVKNIKNPLKTAQDSFKALLNNRNTLLDGISLSPCWDAYGSKIKNVPTNKGQFP